MKSYKARTESSCITLTQFPPFYITLEHLLKLRKEYWYIPTGLPRWC